MTGNGIWNREFVDFTVETDLKKFGLPSCTWTPPLCAQSSEAIEMFLDFEDLG
jgi:hypothetical protein